MWIVKQKNQFIVKIMKILSPWWANSKIQITNDKQISIVNIQEPKHLQ